MQTWPEIVHDVQENWIVYASMPVIAAVIGWGTKLVAIRMIFRPHVFKGIGPIGWQGIIPKRTPEMVQSAPWVVQVINQLTGSQHGQPIPRARLIVCSTRLRAASELLQTCR